jgi:hypothetical protein
MFDLIFSAYDKTFSDHEKPSRRTPAPVSLKFLFGFDMMDLDRENSIRADSGQTRPEKVIFVFPKQ